MIGVLIDVEATSGTSVIIAQISPLPASRQSIGAKFLAIADDASFDLFDPRFTDRRGPLGKNALHGRDVFDPVAAESGISTSSNKDITL